MCQYLRASVGYGSVSPHQKLLKLSMCNRVSPFSGGRVALPSAAVSGGGGCVLLPFSTVPTHKRTDSPH